MRYYPFFTNSRFTHPVLGTLTLYHPSRSSSISNTWPFSSGSPINVPSVAGKLGRNVFRDGIHDFFTNAADEEIHGVIEDGHTSTFEKVRDEKIIDEVTG
jgi:hypothetical protein